MPLIFKDYNNHYSFLGLVFDESASRDKTLEEAAAKPKIALQEDPRQSQVFD